MRTLLVATMAVACVYPDFTGTPTTTFKCDDQNLCPAGYGCLQDNRCYADGTRGCLIDPISRYWSFDTDTQGWVYEPGASTGQVGWTGDQGASRPGALDVRFGAPSNTTETVGFVTLASMPGNMTDKMLQIRVWSEEPGIYMKAFATDADRSAWADGGADVLPPGEWLCRSLDFDHPVGDGAVQFDKTSVFRFGIAIEGATTAGHVMIDDVGY